MGEAFIVRKGGVGGIDATFDNKPGDPSVLDFVGNTNNYGNGAFVQPRVTTIATDNDFIYAAGFGTNEVKKYHIDNRQFVGATNSYGFLIESISIDDDFIYAGGGGNVTAHRNVKKWHKGNLAFVGNTNAYGGTILSIAIDNDFIYAGGVTAQTVKKWHKGNLAFVGNTNDYGGQIMAAAVDNDFIYAVGFGGSLVKKWHKGNLAFSANSSVQSSRGLAVDDDFVYSSNNWLLYKYNKSNLSLAATAENFGEGRTITDVADDNNFVYASFAQDDFVRKFNKSDFSFVGNTNTYNATICTVTIDNNFIYVGGQGNATSNANVKVYTARGPEIENGIIIFNGDTYVKQ